MAAIQDGQPEKTADQRWSPKVICCQSGILSFSNFPDVHFILASHSLILNLARKIPKIFWKKKPN